MFFFSALQLQDLVESPGIQNPTLNTAKCVIQGHEPNICATGRSRYIRTVLWCSFGFVILSSPLLSLYILEMQKKAWPDKNEEEDDVKKKKKNMAKAICILSFFLFFLFFVTLFVVLVYSSICSAKGEESLLFDIPVIIGVLFAYSLPLFCIIKCIHKEDVKWYSYFFIFCTIVTSYHFCWLMIGIMINPTWGLTVALVVCSTFAAFTYAIYLYFDATDDNNGSNWYPSLFCSSGFLAVLLLVIIILLAGQSYNGKETADEVLKTTLLYVISAFISWITWKKHSSPVGETSPSSNATTADGQTPSMKREEKKKKKRKNDDTLL